MPTTNTAKLYGHWLALWNGDTSYAPGVVAPQCTIHHPALEHYELEGSTGPERMASLVKHIRAPFARLLFTLEVGPIEEGDKMAARWTARGSHADDQPDATAVGGSTVEFSGIDLCRLVDGKIAEFWGSSDVPQQVAQASALPAKG